MILSATATFCSEVDLPLNEDPESVTLVLHALRKRVRSRRDGLTWEDAKAFLAEHCDRCRFGDGKCGSLDAALDKDVDHRIYPLDWRLIHDRGVPELYCRGFTHSDERADTARRVLNEMAAGSVCA